MKRLYIILATAFATVLIILFPYATINPGELAEAHRELNNQCFSCHKPFAGIDNEKCVSCHDVKDIGKNNTGKQNKPLFHQQLSNQECGSCHSEHQGLIPEHRLSSFKHELLAASVTNNCISCHNKPSDKLRAQVWTNCSSCHQTQSWIGLTSFNHEALLNKSTCASCHHKPKDNFHNFTVDNCDKCHSPAKWRPSTFDHSAFFTLDQNHNSTCNTCHTNNKFSSFTCYGCYEHSERGIIEEHNEEGIYTIGKCASCHKSGNKGDVRNDNTNPDEKDQNRIRDFIKSSNKKENEDD